MCSHFQTKIQIQLNKVMKGDFMPNSTMKSLAVVCYLKNTTKFKKNNFDYTWLSKCSHRHFHTKFVLLFPTHMASHSQLLAMRSLQ